MKNQLLYIIIVVIAAISCGSSKNSTSQDEQNSSSNQSENTNTASTVSGNSSSATSQTQMAEQIKQSETTQEAVKYRMIVTFISIGEGIDAKARQQMDTVLQNWQTKTGKKLQMETYPWGREGEADFCFLLNELSAPDQAELTREMRIAFQGNQLIQISEFQESMHKK